MIRPSSAGRSGADTPARRRRTGPLLLVLATVLALLAAGTVWAVADEGPPIGDLRTLVPNAPGGGYDVTARTAAKVLQNNEITGPTEVFNLPGAGGVAGLGRIVSERGNDRLTLSMGLGLVGAARFQDATGLLAQATPVARLIRETEIVVVPAGSPVRDLRGLLAEWTADPRAHPVGGGSSPGGPDHLATMLLAEQVGLAPRRVDYVAHDGGGELLRSLLAGEVQFAVSGLGEFADQVDSGALRVLAVTAGERVPGVAAPTLREAGVDLEYTNWRGVLAPPGLSEQGRRELQDAYAALVRSPEWGEVLRRNNWQDAYLPGPEFAPFLATEEERVGRVLAELGID